MKSSFELEVATRWAQERLVGEAERERLAAQVAPRRRHLRAQLALALYALAERLSPDAVLAAPRLKEGLEPT